MQRKVKSFPLVSDINKVVAREWMGCPEVRDSPVYNLKKIYKYDIDRNSGYYKKWTEKIRDSIQDNTSPWIVGGLISLVFAILLSIQQSPAYLSIKSVSRMIHKRPTT